MLRAASREEVRSVAGPLWLLVNGTQWPGDAGHFDIVKNGASSITAHLAYCAIGAEEREKRNRAKVIPCRVFQDLVVGEDFDFIEALRSVDIQDAEVVRTRFFVAVILPMRTMLLIGVRGTQFAYDWLVNLKFIKGREPSGEYFHIGFLREAQELARCLRESLRDRYSARIARADCAIYLSGHSLGGAVAAILNHMDFPAPINACYTFGAPRVSNSHRLGKIFEPFATRRHLDIVPHCPPSAFNYWDFENQMAPNGERYEPANGLEMYFFASWLFQLAVSRFPAHHSMERYRFDVLQSVKTDPRVLEYWERRNFTDIAP